MTTEVAGGLLWLPSCGSTNDEARARLGDPHVGAVATDAQTAGRGRRGRTWFSPPGCGLYLTWIVRGRVAPMHAGVLPLLAGVVTARLCESLGARPMLKWPNDLLLGGRKLAGVLCESRVDAAGMDALVGIGLNLRAPPGGYPPEVPGVALETPLGAAEVARRLHAALDAALDALPPNAPFAGVLPDWRARGPAPGTPMRVGEVTGTFADLAPDGALLLDAPTGRLRVDAGEVELVATLDGQAPAAVPDTRP
jgi:BirA family biotin operon repressor/biotin-[acetyl-CoA-carboxylase] ligase